MPISSRITSAFFTALPGLTFFALYISSGSVYKDYFWNTYLIVVSVLAAGGVLFGFSLPPLLQGIGLHPPWMWIMAQGALTAMLALFVFAVLNATPMCVGQDNGDGNNNLGMCMAYTVLVAVVYTPVFVGLLAVSAWVGHWKLSLKMKSETH